MANPTQPPRMQVQHRGEVELALVGGDLGQIAAPAHVRPRGRVKSRPSASGALRADLSGLVVDRAACVCGRATSPCSAISAATVFSLTRQPSSRRSAVIRGDP